MSRALALFAIGLVFGGGIGFVVAAGNGITFNGHDHADIAAHGDMDHGMMHGSFLDVPAATAPKITVQLTPDVVEGYNLHVETQNFTFAPQAAGLDNVSGQGHAHVYVNGVKLRRLYSEWMHIANLPKGTVTVEVTLNSNMHNPLAVAGQPISASTRLVVQ